MPTIRPTTVGLLSASLTDPPIETGKGIMQPAECRAIRISVGWSPQQLAEKAGFKAETIISFEEKGRPLPLSAQVALRRVVRKELQRQRRYMKPG